MSKFTKLISNPGLFFSDSLKKRHAAPADRVQKPAPAAPKTASAAPKTVPATPKTAPATPPKPTKLVWPKPAEGERYPKIGTLRKDWKLSLADVAPRDRNSAPLLIASESQAADLFSLVEAMAAHGNFKPFLPDNVGVVWSEPLPSGAIDDVVNGVDVAHKTRLSRYRHLVLLDQDPLLCAGLRASQAHCRTVVILTNPSISLPEGADIDALIVPVGHPVDNSVRRRFEFTPGEEAWPQIAMHLRRFVRDTQPREGNLLLPALGQLDYEPDLVKVDTRYTEGILILAELPSALSAPLVFKAYVAALARSMTGLLLDESNLLRYQTLLDAARNDASNEASARLLATLLRDGVRIDVRH